MPWFLWMFLGLVAWGSTSGVPDVAQQAMEAASRACLVVAIAALGIKTSFVALARAGWRPIALLLIETMWLAGLILAYVLLAGR